MEDEHQAIIKEIQKTHEKRMNDITNIKDLQLVVFDGFAEEIKTKIISYEDRISEYENVIAKKNLQALKNLAKERVSLHKIAGKLEFPNPPTFVPCNFVAMVENMGKLHVASVPKALKSFKLITPFVVSDSICPGLGIPRICIIKEGDIWLGESESREMVMVDIKGQVLRRRNIQNKPYAMAVMDCGDVILSSNVQYSGLVSRLLGDGREQHVFDTSPSYCNGVSVIADGKMLICTYDGRVVMVNVDGTKMKQIYKGSGKDSARHAVEDADGNIYVSDYLNYAVVKVNKDGKFSSKITHTTGGQDLGRPSGLVVDTMNNILCADSYKHCVYIIDQNQQMRELVGRSHGIKHPQWLAVDCENNLWITQGDENVFVVRYLST